MKILSFNTLGFVIAIFSILITFAVSEIYFRVKIPDVVAKRNAIAMYYNSMEYHPVLGRVLKKGYSGRIKQSVIDFKVKFNSKGLRDREFEYEKPESIIRILVLGDSFTYGYGVENKEAYPKVLERILKQHNKNNIEVLNAGVSGWGTWQEKEFLKTTGIKYEPDIILVGYYLNDVFDTQSFSRGMKTPLYYWEKEQAFLRKIVENNYLLKFDFYMSEYSYLYLFLKDRFYILIQKFDDLQNVVGEISNPNYTIPGGDNLNIADLNYQVTEYGEIVSWKAFSMAKAKVKLKVWRNIGGNLHMVGESEMVDLVMGNNSFELKNRISINPGDYLGFYSTKSSFTRNVPYKGKEKVYVYGDSNIIPLNTNAHDRAAGYSFKAYYETYPEIENDPVNEEEKILGEIIQPDYQKSRADAELSIVDLNYQAPENGSITTWKIYSMAEGKAKLKIWRLLDGNLKQIGESRLEDIEIGYNNFTLNENIQIITGDFLGFYTTMGNIPHNIPSKGGRKYYARGDVNSIALNTSNNDLAANFTIKAYFVPLVEKMGSSVSASNENILEKNSSEITAENSGNTGAKKQIDPPISFKSNTHYEESFPQFRETYSAELEEARIKTIDYLEGIHKIGVDAGAKVYVVYIPHFLEVNREKDVPSSWSRTGKINRDKPHTLFYEWLDNKKIKYIDIVDSLKNSQKESLYLYDGHFDKNGQEATAEAIFEEMEKRGEFK
jgi:hypothetical protein